MSKQRIIDKRRFIKSANVVDAVPIIKRRAALFDILSSARKKVDELLKGITL